MPNTPSNYLMKSSRILPAFVFAIVVAWSGPAFAEKFGVAFPGSPDLQQSISSALTAEGHEVVDLSKRVNGMKLDAGAAASIGQKTQVDIIVFGRKLGNIIVLKILSTRNDTVAGGTAADEAGVVEQVRKILEEHRSKLTG